VWDLLLAHCYHCCRCQRCSVLQSISVALLTEGAYRSVSEGVYVPLVRKSLSPGMSLGNTPLPMRTGHRNLLISSDEYPVRPEIEGG
jgi:hypothetical protein